MTHPSIAFSKIICRAAFLSFDPKIAVIVTDENKIIRGFNNAAASLWGIPKKEREAFIAREVIGHHANVLVPNSGGKFHKIHNGYLDKEIKETRNRAKSDGLDEMQKMGAGKPVPIDAWCDEERKAVLQFKGIFDTESDSVCLIAIAQPENAEVSVEEMRGKLTTFATSAASSLNAENIEGITDRLVRLGKAYAKLGAVIVAGSGALIAGLEQTGVSDFFQSKKEPVPIAQPKAEEVKPVNKDDLIVGVLEVAREEVGASIAFLAYYHYDDGKLKLKIGNYQATLPSQPKIAPNDYPVTEGASMSRYEAHLNSKCVFYEAQKMPPDDQLTQAFIRVFTKAHYSCPIVTNEGPALVAFEYDNGAVVPSAEELSKTLELDLTIKLLPLLNSQSSETI